MTISLIESVQTDTATSAVKSISFGTTPNEGDLLVFFISIANTGADYVPVGGNGLQETVPVSTGLFRTVAVFHKIATGSEVNDYPITIGVASSHTVEAWRFSADNPMELADFSVHHETGDVATLTGTLAAAENSLVLAFAYTSSTALKSWNSGWLNPMTGFSLRRSSTWKLSAGGTETATLTLDEGTNNRMSMVMVQFAEGDPVPTVVLNNPLTPGASMTGSYSGFTAVPVALRILDNVAEVDELNRNIIGSVSGEISDLVITDGGDGTGTFAFTMPALPSSGSMSSVLFGAVDVELST